MYESKLYLDIEQLELETEISIWDLSIEELIKVLYRLDIIDRK